MSPTTAPNFVQLVEYGAGCPDEYNADSRYASGDIVSYSRAPNRILVYECKVRETLIEYRALGCLSYERLTAAHTFLFLIKKWPHTAYCNVSEQYVTKITGTSTF
jgi:hypothetical protein